MQMLQLKHTFNNALKASNFLHILKHFSQISFANNLFAKTKTQKSRRKKYMYMYKEDIYIYIYIRRYIYKGIPVCVRTHTLN